MKESIVIMLFQSRAFRLHPASIATMAEFTLSFLIVGYFLSLKGKTRDTWLMVGYVGLAMLVYLVDIGVTSSKPPIYIYFRVSHTILISIWTLFGTWCAYTYRGHPLSRLGISVIIIEGLLLGGIIADLILKVIANRNALYHLPFSIIYVIVGLQAWSSIVLLSRSVIASNHQENSQATIKANLLNLVALPAQSIRALGLLFTFWVIFTMGTIIFGSALIYHIGQMALLLGVLVVHLNYANEVTTFQVKLVSLPLATTLALLGILPFLLFVVPGPEDTWYINDGKMQQQLSVFAWLIPFSSAFILVAFIFFYWVGLLRPLGKLLDGVRRIEEGDLTVQVPILTRDEIGHFAYSLNTMATSLKASHEELESRVIERTEELQASLVRLQATQAQLIQSEKMASLGELTAGIAHEIQNPLNFVNNFSEVNKELIVELKKEIDNGDLEEVKAIASDIEENEQKIIHHGKRADSIVKGMLQHSRASTGKIELTDINALVDECIRLSYHGMRAKDKKFTAEIKADLDTTIDKIEIVPQDISRVLLNLFNNAFYEVHEKKAKLNGTFEPIVSVCTKKLDGKVEIHVRDNGNGIPQNIVDKIFQPFFTTKPTGQGTGLGLSLSYDIVKAHGGEIRVESKGGEGSEFVIRIPV